MRPILALAVSSLLAQQDTTIRLDVQQVLVPIVVTDKKGHHISGLHASDFHVFEDGVQQEIASFSSATTAAVADIGALSKSQPARAAPRHTFVICIDTLHASPASAARTREALEKLFESEKGADAQFVLIAIGRQLQVLQAATPSPLAILLKLRSPVFQAAMGGLDASALAAQLQNIKTRMDEFCKRCACGPRSGSRNCDSEIDTLKQSVDAEAERWTAPTSGLLDQFKKVVEELAKLPTGRTLILISDGFNIDPKQEFYRAISAYLPNIPQFTLPPLKPDALQEALKIASDRSVTIDAVDARGATASFASSGSMDASASAGSGGGSMLGTNRPATPARADTLRTTDSRANPAQESAAMEQLARATGGVYFHDSGDMLKQFRSALADGREYYVLAYTPKNNAHDGKYRTIVVESPDKKLSIRAKSGYWAPQ